MQSETSQVGGGRPFWRRGPALAGMAGILGVAVWLVGSGTAQQPAPVEGVRRPTVPMKSAAEWQKQFPFKSVAEQLASEAQRAQQTPPAVTAPSLTKEALKSLDDAERLYTASSPWGNMRRESLKLLHSKEVEEFVKRPGFGLSRMPTPSVRYLDLPKAVTLPLGTVGYPESVLINDAKAELPPTGQSVAGPSGLPTLQSLAGLHAQSGYAFISPDSLGYVKSPKTVAGFDPHKFRYAPMLGDQRLLKHDPGQKEKWVLKRLELVSLLKHDQPVAYVSDELPKMENLKNAPTRGLDGFETVALKRLQAGEDVVTDATLNRIRMVGALRANKGCLECHTAQRGQLLGVFSYEILRDPPIRKK